MRLLQKNMMPQICKLILLIIFLFPHLAFSIEPDEMLADKKLEREARIISSKLRCPICQNQTIDDSDAQIASDLRRLVREKLSQGYSEAETIAYIQSRYGDFILLDPQFTDKNYVLWLFPIFFLFSALIFISMKLKKQS